MERARYFVPREYSRPKEETAASGALRRSPNRAAKPLRRLNISADGPSAARAIALTGLLLAGASPNFGMRFGVSRIVR
jgi:hypothetical protein